MPFKLIISLLLMTPHTRSKTRRIVGGDYTNIEEFPHSVFLRFRCQISNTTDSWICGASIINQWLLLSAAHCLDGCEANHTYITAKLGHTDRGKSQTRLVAKHKLHEKYNEMHILNDICLYKLKEELKLGPTVMRVILMKNPPYNEKGIVSGWGFIDDVNQVSTYKLKKLGNLTIYSHEQCARTLGGLPDGTICAQVDAPPPGEDHFTARGDSGSALVVRKYIQVGLISFCNLKRSRTMTVYSDTGYHFHWIKNTAKHMLCT